MEGSDGMGVEGTDSRLYQMIKNEILDGESMDGEDQEEEEQQQDDDDDDTGAKTLDDHRRVNQQQQEQVPLKHEEDDEEIGVPGGGGGGREDLLLKEDSMDAASSTAVAAATAQLEMHQQQYMLLEQQHLKSEHQEEEDQHMDYQYQVPPPPPPPPQEDTSAHPPPPEHLQPDLSDTPQHQELQQDEDAAVKAAVSAITSAAAGMTEDKGGLAGTKRPASDGGLSEEEPAAKKRSNEVDKLWKNVNDNPNDFQAWTLLLQHIDQSDLESGREAYNGFFERYPYCYGYWKKYADLERRKGTWETCSKVKCRPSAC